MKKELNPLKRRFLGNLMGPYNFENKYERNFEKKHLREYLKGSEYFTYGFKEEDGIKKPALFKVLQVFE